MTEPLVVIVSGLPCSGKTRLGERIAARFSLPFISKDGFKERLFDALGWTDRAWSKKLSAASYSILFHVLDAQLEAGRSCVVEGNFDPEVHSRVFTALKRERGFRAVQVHCVTDADVLLERFRARWARGARHPGHADDVMLPEMELLARQERPPLKIDGAVFEFDTTNLQRVDDSRLLEAIASMLT